MWRDNFPPVEKPFVTSEPRLRDGLVSFSVFGNDFFRLRLFHQGEVERGSELGGEGRRDEGARESGRYS